MASFCQFRAFLGRNGCCEQFDRAFAEQNNSTLFDRAVWSLYPFDEAVIGVAFDWTLTDEGRSYWAQIDCLWYAEATRSHTTHSLRREW